LVTVDQKLPEDGSNATDGFLHEIVRERRITVYSTCIMYRKISMWFLCPGWRRRASKNN